jgi:hypothetical protein
MTPVSQETKILVCVQTSLEKFYRIRVLGTFLLILKLHIKTEPFKKIIKRSSVLPHDLKA